MKLDSAIKPLRQSASLILTFSDEGIDARRILMLNRKPHMSFAKALVFPGGVCEQADSKYVESKEFEEFAKITALRELFQETKIVLLPPSVNKDIIKKLKFQFINSGQSKFIDQISKIWSSNLHLLLPVARFVTPQFPKMSRYDCMFYIVEEGIIRLNFGDKESLEHLNIQQEQSSKYFWNQPEQFLKIYNQKSHFLAPPQNIILNALMRIGAKNALNYSKLLDNLVVQPFLGNFQNKMQFLLVGDQQYNSLNVFNKEPQSKSKKQVIQCIVKLGTNTKKGAKRRVVPKDSFLDNGNIMYVYDGLVQQSTILKHLQPFVPDSSL